MVLELTNRAKLVMRPKEGAEPLTPPRYIRVMSAEEPAKVKLKCFVVSPIGASGSEVRKNADQVLKHLIRKALADDYDISRGDHDANPGSITAQIVESILEADLVVADLSGFNPNVYYEVAMAHGYERPTVHLQRADEEPAFDLKDMRLVQYDLTDLDDVERAQKQLREYAKYARENPTKIKTPLSNAKQFVQIGDSPDPVAQSNHEIMNQIRSLRNEVRRMRTPRLVHTRDDVRALREVIERVRGRDELTVEDLQGIISTTTTTEFDDWARRLLGGVTGISEVPTLNDILFDAEVASQTFELDLGDDESERD